MRHKNVLYRILRFIGVLIFFPLYRPTYINKKVIPKKGRIILAGTHASNFDCIMIAGSTKRTVHYLGKIELFRKSKFHNWFFNSVGVIPVDRSKKKNHQAMESAEQVLNQDKVIGIFPEGTFGKGKILPFKLGAVAMAKHTNSLIVPFAITGEYKIFKKGPKVKFGNPLNLNDYELNEANDILRNEVIKLKESLEKDE